MTHTQEPIVQEKPTEPAATPLREGNRSLFGRIGTSLLLFSVVFTGILGVSWKVLLPHLTRIQVDGKTVELSAVLPYEGALRAQILQAETKRNAIVLPIKDTDYDALKRRSLCYPLLEDLRAGVQKTAQTLGENVVLFQEMAYDSAGTLGLVGDIRNVGPRSMTVLAQFADALKDLPFVTAVTAPVFTRQSDPMLGFHSPFSLMLNLKASDDCPVIP